MLAFPCFAHLWGFAASQHAAHIEIAQALPPLAFAAGQRHMREAHLHETDPYKVNLSPQLTKLFLNLRLAAILVFPFGVLLIAIMQRSVLMVGALAIGMVVSNRLEQMRFQSAVGALEKMRAAQRFKMNGVVSGFAVRAAVLAGLFILFIGVMALFRDTSLARGFGWIDLALWLGITGFAVAANEISARMVQEQASGAIHTLRAAMHPEEQPSQMDGEIIEGEIVDDHAHPPRDGH